MKGLARWRRISSVTAAVAALIPLAAWIAWAHTTWAQRPAATAPQAPAGAAGVADGPRFTGESRALDTDGLRLSHRWFEPGARTAWHRHVHGQLLFVEHGRGRIQKRGGPIREVGPGDSDYTPPNVDHWHGAVPDQEFTQVAVAFGEDTVWLELVTDEEYHGH